MTTKSIKFNDDMIQAILDGRKTQTRRPIKPQPYDGKGTFEGVGFYSQYIFHPEGGKNEGCSIDYVAIKCPYGKPGDLLWVQESGITLRIKSIWVKHLQDITEEGASAEGCQSACDECGDIFHIERNALGYCCIPDCTGESFSELKGFQNLWDSIYADKGYGWSENPWVWVIDFERVA